VIDLNCHWFAVLCTLLKMGNLFTKKDGKSRITDQDKAVLGLKQQRDKLNQYKKRIERNLEREREVAKTLLKQGKKEKAKTLLKKKRYQENLLGKCDGQLDTIQGMIDSLEFAQIEMKVVEDLKAGNESLKQLHSLMSVEDVERIMDETREAVEYQREIDDLLSGAGLTQEDEDAVLQELEALTEDADLQALEEAPKILEPAAPAEKEAEPELPEVPTAEPGEERQAAASNKKKKQSPDAAVAMLAS